MNKLANVLYAYSPKNDDELELKVGDRIEVIGFEEEGWWKGRLKNRIGVFPSNFVQVIETSSPNATQPIVSSPPTSVANQANKLNLFSSKTSKTSLSTNSLNSNNSNNNSYNINNNNSNNHMMNNTQQQENSGLACGEESLIASSERRPKPIRGVGYGDIFASGGGKPKPLPADPTSNLTSERLSTSLASTLQKQIPKKPPPPAPTVDTSNGTSSEQAPALPPKPANQQFSPHLQHPRSLSPAQQQQQQPFSITQQVREQAKVIFAYEPLNDDELAMEVGDIIDIIDKDIEDAGWWKGELRGKVGVFPDNFVQLIGIQETSSQTQDWGLHRNPTISQPTTPSFNPQAPAIEGKVKSVFASTPKGFTKQLENNLDKHNNSSASFLSLKRNKIQQQLSITEPEATNMNENGKKEVESVSQPDTNTTKLNHITANRAKGPSRRPPSNILNKRNQIDHIKKESNGKDEQSLGSLPIGANPQPIVVNESLSSLPPGQQQQTTPSQIGQFSSKPNDYTSPVPIKPSLSLDNVIVENQTLAPKTSQRVTQVTALDKNKTAATPPWMVELKKAHAERKRDSPALNATTTTATTTATTPTTLEEPLKIEPERLPEIKVAADSASPPNLNSAQYDSLVRQISKNVTSEISELKEEVKRLQQDFQGINELKGVLEAMRIELKACQSATENQKRYIKELVNNLADERKKIAAMQVEIDRTLK